jgi:hypothetical protein
MRLESYRSTSGPLEFLVPVFSTVVSTRHLKKVLTRFGPELVPGWHFVDSTHVKVHAGTGAPALDLSSQAFSFALGPVMLNIPAGGFHLQKGIWVFQGPVGSAAVQARISSPSTGVYALQVEASGIEDRTSDLSSYRELV